MNASVWDRLKEPFPADAIEWRIGRAGVKDGKPWAMVLAYVTNRAIMDRLDEVVGPGNWWNEYQKAPVGEGLLCGISVRLEDGRVVTKWDGAEPSDIEPLKGCISGSMKRAAVLFGIGRYLYLLEEGFANIHDKGQFRGEAKEKSGERKSFKWDPPRLPSWALPKPPERKASTAPKKSREEMYAARIRELAIEIDGQRDRTGKYEETSAQHEADAFLSDPQCNAASMEAYGNKLGRELERMKSLPDAVAATSYETYVAPPLEGDADELPFD